jgi:aryl-alcohol dehydrogenase-like predicted oxidoreductase
MEYITLKNSELSVSRLCVGGDPFGGHGWGTVLPEDIIESVHTAMDAGVNFFDTADVYGLGESERMLGKAIGSRRASVIIATKFGVRRTSDNANTYYDNSPEWIREAIVGSLKRLGTDYIDLYQMHYRDGVTSLEDVIEALDKLKAEGVIRAYGLSNVFAKDVPELINYRGKFVSFQNEYSLANREHEPDIHRIVDEVSVTPMTWGSLGQGILTGKYGRDVQFDESDRRSRAVYKNFHGAKLEKNMDIVDKMKAISAMNGKPIPSIAIRFILDYLADSVVIAGVKTKAQVLSNLDAFGWSLDNKQMAELNIVSRD